MTNHDLQKLAIHNYFVGVFTPHMPSYARLFRCTVRTFTLPEVNCLLELEPQFTLPDHTHRGGLFCSAVQGAGLG